VKHVPQYKYEAEASIRAYKDDPACEELEKAVKEAHVLNKFLLYVG